MWSWLGDEFDFAKLLAGEGGRGKTSIAYEFSRQVCESSIEKFDYILWLTGKKQQFSAKKDKYIDTPEYHFECGESLLKAICIKLAGEDPVSIDDVAEKMLLRLAKNTLSDIRTLLVVDDVDSLSPNEQKRVLEIVRKIASGDSKVILTTRANVSYSSDSCIEVPGMEFSEFSKLVDSLSKRMKCKNITAREKKKLHGVSDGSPLFTESILRLMAFGVGFSVAVKEWEGKGGELVRSAVLMREIESLSSDARSTLLAIAIMEDCSITEIKNVLSIPELTLRNAIEELDSLFLVHSPSITSDEPRFELSSTTARLVIDSRKGLIPQSDEIIGKVKLLRSSNVYRSKKSSQKEIGAAINQANALLRAQDYPRASATIASMLKIARHSKNSDLLFMDARIKYVSGNYNSDSLRKDFQKAHDLGQRHELMYRLWFELEQSLGSLPGMRGVCDHAIDGAGLDSQWWLIRRLSTLERLARSTGSFEISHSYYKECRSTINKLLSSSGKVERASYIKLARSLADEVCEKACIEGEFIISYKFLNRSARDGDKRISIYESMIKSLSGALDLSYKSSNRTRRYRSDNLSEVVSLLNEFLILFSKYRKTYPSPDKLILVEDLIGTLENKIREEELDLKSLKE